jgi:hypothetical protein
MFMIAAMNAPQVVRADRSLAGYRREADQAELFSWRRLTGLPLKKIV